MVHSRETAAALTIVANSTIYDAQVARLTCLKVKQQTGSGLQTRAEKGTGYELGTGLEHLGNAVADRADRAIEL